MPDSLTPDSPTPASHLPLSEPVFEILLALADAPRHGYGIMQEVDARTGGRVSLGPGTLYGAIKRLLAQELVEEVEDPAPADADERRRYYGLTRRGREVARLEAARLESLLDAARAKRLVRRPT